MTFNKTKMLFWLKFIMVAYALIGIALYYLQEKFIFHPKKLNSNYTYKFDGRFEEINVPLSATDTMNLVKFYPTDSISKGIVIYYHGNKEGIEHYADYTKIFTKLGYEVWMEDYPGFGKSTGELTEKKLYDQALQVRKMASVKFTPNQIIIFGKSLGTGIAAYVASNTNAKMLILETPYFSIPSLFSTYACIYPTNAMAKYKIPTYQFLKDVKCPVTIFHGTNDWVIPYRNAKKLTAVIKPTDTFITITGATHNNLNKSNTFLNTITNLLK